MTDIGYLEIQSKLTESYATSNHFPCYLSPYNTYIWKLAFRRPKKIQNKNRCE
jgi:hypothetical protein